MSLISNPILLATVLCLPAGVSCKPDTGAAAPPPAVVTKAVMRNMQFSPAVIGIQKGGTIQWTNEDLTPHTVTSPTFGDSGALASGQAWSHTFNETGEFSYVCTFHPTMKGKVIVK